MDNSTPKSKFPSTGFIVLLLAIVVIAIFARFVKSGPTISVERRDQRVQVMERAQSAGGWDAIRRDCTSFAEQHTNGVYTSWHDTNGWPAAIVALSPIEIEYEPGYGCVSMRIFGQPRTGGHSEPYFGLEVDVSSNSVGYQHGTGYSNGGVVGNHHSVAEQVAKGIYEIY